MSILTKILGFFPSVLLGIVAVEQTVGNQIPGAAKKDLVLAAVQTAAQVGETIDSKVIQGISALIDNLVGALNKSSILGFGKSTTPVAVTTSGGASPATTK